MAEQEARALNLSVSDADVAAEEQRTLDRMFKDQGADPGEYPVLLSQFLERRNMTRPEWALLMRINATLRAVAEPQARGKITDAQLEEAFLQLYGEKVQVRHIQCSNLQEIAEARRRLAEGTSFEQVARDLSRNPRTAPLGGELQAFTRQSPYPQAFKDAAFALREPGQVSDPVQAENAYHLLQLTQRIPPKVMKFEDVKGSIREDLEQALIQQLVGEIRQQLSEAAARSLEITDPVLREQYGREQGRREQQLRDRDDIRREFERQREREREAAATQQAIPDLPPAPGAPPGP